MTPQPENLDVSAFLDPSTDYPANQFAIQYAVDALADVPAPTLVEVGVGHGTAIAPLTRAGIRLTGFDIDASSVESSRGEMATCGIDPERVTVGDIEDPVTHTEVTSGGPYDALLALGILPNVVNESQTLLNMRALVRPGGHLFVEFRNVLFSLFTFNRYTRDFIVDDVLADVSDDMRTAVSDFLATRVDLDRPPRPAAGSTAWRFHNPFEVAERFTALGFEDIRTHYFHYHPAMPFMAAKHPAEFRSESLKLENETSGWRGMFLASAFLIHARRPGEAPATA